MSGFCQSNGNDLDNLFYSSWDNSGGLGFVQSDGWDLGNRYSSQNTLGYSVGFYTSSGTDLGYLRGDKKPYDLTVSWASTAYYWKFTYDSTSYKEFYRYTCSFLTNSTGVYFRLYYLVETGCLACYTEKNNDVAPSYINDCPKYKYLTGQTDYLYLYKTLTTRDTGYYLTL
jgi:hypothetical protein